MQNSNGYDVIFSSDANCATKLNHEVETYNTSTGAVNYWVKAWVKTTSTTGYQQILSRYGYGDANGGYELLLYNGKVRLDIFHSGTSYTWLAGNTVMSANVWHHVAAVFDGNECRVYLDGALDGGMTSTFAPYSGTGNLIIGRAGGDAVQYFNGQIDEVRVSSGALYTGNFTPSVHLEAGAGVTGLWKFDGQTANDSSGNGNNGTLVSGANYSSDVPTQVGHSLALNGSSQYVEIPNSDSLNITGALTLEAWVKTTSATGYQQIVSRYGYGAANGGYELLLYNGKVRLDIFHSGTSYTWLAGNTVMSANVWHHVAAVFDGNECRVYLDGVLDGGMTSTFAPYSGTGNLIIGRAGGDAVQYFNGLIDEVRVTAGALYTGDFVPAAHLEAVPNMAGLWKFDNQTASDSSSNGNNGTVQGSATFSSDVKGDSGGGTTLAQLHWMVTDQLGTPRMVFDQSGSLANVSRHDYLPFGEEIFAGTGGRTSAQGYTLSDNVRQKFTSKERDNETGLDYFLARYYSSTQGRFTSPDEFTGGPDELYYFVDDASANPTFYADLRKPQSLNKYQYAYNNPLRWIDLDGHDANEPDPEPQGQTKSNTIPVPTLTPISIPEAQQLIEALKRANEAVDDALYPYSQIIGTAPAGEIAPVPLPTTGTPPSQQAQPLPPPAPIQKKDSVRTATRTPGGVAPGKSVTDKQAADRLKSGGDTLSPSRAKAKQLAKKAAPDGRVVRDRAHQPGYRPHYHDKKRGKGHSFYD